MKKANKIILAIALCILSLCSHAANVPKIYFIQNDISAVGNVKDGTIVGTGKLSYEGEHVGFHVWIDDKYSSLNNTSTLYSNRHSSKPLRVRIESPQHASKIVRENGIKIFTHESHTTFQIVLDGNQDVSPGSLSFRLGAAAIIAE